MVRPLDVDPGPRRRTPLLIGAAVVVLGGFGLFLAGGGLSRSVPTTTAATTTSSTTSPPPTTVVNTATLRQLVPGLQGTVRGVLAVGAESYVWTWASGEAEPRLTVLPNEARGSWDAGLGLVGAIAESSFGRSLFFGPITNIREVHNDVESLAWHDTTPGAIAFLTEPQPDGSLELWRSRPSGIDAFSASLVNRFEIDGELVAYGDWGFALAVADAAADEPLQVVTLDSIGQVTARAPVTVADTFTDGTFAVVTNPQGPGPRTALTTDSFEELVLVGPEDTVDAAFSPNGRWLALLALDPSGASVWLMSTEDLSEIEGPLPLGVDAADVEGWSDDGRWLLLSSEATDPGLVATRLLFVDLGSGSVHDVTTPGSVSGLSIEATGNPGPTRFFVP